MHRSFLLSVIVVGVTLNLMTTSVAGQRENQVPDVTGQWMGFFNDGEDVIQVTLKIATQDARRFDGTIFMGIDPEPFKVQGTIAGGAFGRPDGSEASGIDPEPFKINFVGKDDAGGKLDGHAVFTNFSGGVHIAVGDVNLQNDHEREVAGGLVLLRPFSDDQTPLIDVSGTWEGTYISVLGHRGSVDADFAAILDRGDLTTSFAASFGINPCVYPNGLGTLGENGEFALIGAGPEGQAILVGILDPDPASGINPCVRGPYMQILGDGTTQDVGEFEIILQ